MLDGFAPAGLAGRPKEQQAWAVQQLEWAAEASNNLGLKAHATFSGALAWPYFYPWPQRPAGLIDAAFEELGRRWTPILNLFDEAGVDVCFELHPGEDLHDGITFERFLKAVNNHKRANILYDPSHMVLQQLDYLEFIDFYHDRIRAFHVKDAEFRPNGKAGVYGGYQDWIDRPGRFRSLGDGQVDFKAIFSKMAQYRLSGLGGAGVGVLHQASEGGGSRGREPDQAVDHPRYGKGVRRLRRIRCRRGEKPQHPGVGRSRSRSSARPGFGVEAGARGRR